MKQQEEITTTELSSGEGRLTTEPSPFLGQRIPKEVHKEQKKEENEFRLIHTRLLCPELVKYIPRGLL